MSLMDEYDEEPASAMVGVPPRKRVLSPRARGFCLARESASYLGGHAGCRESALCYVCKAQREEVAIIEAEAYARGLAAREGTLSREDVAAWLDKLAEGHSRQLQQTTFESSIDLMSGALIAATAAADAARNGAIEAWLASRAKGK